MLFRSTEHFGKSDIFSKRVVEKAKEPKPHNVKDAIITSMYQNGRVDVEYIANALGKSEDEVKDEIINSGLGFENPITRQIEVSYQYKSGNVREKLRQALDNNEGGRYNANIKALESVIPMNIPAHLINFTFGSSWIDPKLYEDYVKERTNVNVKFTSAGGTWFMDAPNYIKEEKDNSFGVKSLMFNKIIPGHQLIEAAIQNKSIIVSRTYKENGKDVDLGTNEGVYIAKVDEDGNGAAAGLKEGDVITKVDGKKVTKMAELQESLNGKRPGDKMSITYLRNKKTNTKTITLKNAQGNTSVIKSADLDVLGGTFRPISESQKNQLSIKYGVEVMKVNSGALKDAGVSRGFIIQRINDNNITSLDDLQKAVKSASTSKDPVLYIQGVWPTGKKAYFAVPLQKD